MRFGSLALLVVNLVDANGMDGASSSNRGRSAPALWDAIASAPRLESVEKPHGTKSAGPGKSIVDLKAQIRAAPSAIDEARLWFRVANEQSRLGSYDEALDSYARQLALGHVDPAALVNGAELLMATGRLPEAIRWYSEAVTIEERDRDRRSHVQGLALGYFGLGVALDRDNRPVAAREAIGHALAFDPALGVLRLAERGDGDLIFVPPGDVFYYLGLARETQGRAPDAAAAFRDYLRIASGPYTHRAREHLLRLASTPVAGQPDGSARGRFQTPVQREAVTAAAVRGIHLRVVHEATLVADGPLVAPMIDAAWRLDDRMLDSCLSDVALTSTPAPTGGAPPASARQFKLLLAVQFNEDGHVDAAVMEPAATGLDATVGHCIENAVKTRFRVSRPNRHKATRARIELVLAPAEPGGL